MRGILSQLVRGILLLGILPSLAAAQQPLPSVNLGFTTFLDGGPPAGPGLYFQEYGSYYTAGTFRDQQGNKAPLLGSLGVWASLNQLIYQSDQDILLGGKWGVDVILPLVGIDVSPGPVPAINGGSSGGIGDMVIGPYLQWDPIMGKNGPLFMHRIELQNVVPTGTYDKHRALNPGANFYSFNPYWAATVFMLPEWTASLRLHYLVNAKNEDPNVALNANSAQAGQAIHFNYATEYEIIPKQLRLGLNGYYLKQFTNAERNGDSLPGTREQVFAVGPGLLYSFSQNDHLFFNAYWEMLAQNRPEGERFVLRWTHHF